MLLIHGVESPGGQIEALRDHWDGGYMSVTRPNTTLS